MYNRILPNEVIRGFWKKLILIDKRSVYKAPLHLPWTLFSKDAPFGMASAICEHENKANEMAEKPN